MIKPHFSSPLAPYMDRFLVECSLTRRSLGDITTVLNLFDKYLCSINLTSTYVTEQIFDAWVNTFINVNTPKTSYRKRSYIILLLEYMASLGVNCYIPKRVPYKKSGSYVPYIFTHEEMLRIFNVADHWSDICIKPDSALFAMPLLLRILYSTGMRISEAINLKNKDVRLDIHAFKLEKTKNNSERLSPINHDLELAIITYLKFRDLIPSKNLSSPNEYFLVNHRGNPLTSGTILARFHKILDEAGVKGNNPKSGARIHDLRHTACIHVMMKLIDEGRDLYNCIPVISEFMGHESLFSTERYLRFTAEMYPQYITYSQSANVPITDVITKAIDFEDEYE